MEEPEIRAMRREILDDISAMLREDLAANEWGRLLVEVIRGPQGAPVVAGIDVEEVIGDEARVDEIFGGSKARAVLPVLAKTIEALCMLDDVDLEQVRGGTFVRLADERAAWLPGFLVQCELSAGGLDRERDDLVRKMRGQNNALFERFGRPDGDRLGVDLVTERVAWKCPPRPPFQARATLLGTFAPGARTWLG